MQSGVEDAWQRHCIGWVIMQCNYNALPTSQTLRVFALQCSTRRRFGSRPLRVLTFQFPTFWQLNDESAPGSDFRPICQSCGLISHPIDYCMESHTFPLPQFFFRKWLGLPRWENGTGIGTGRERDWDSMRERPWIWCILRETETASFKEILEPWKLNKETAKNKAETRITDTARLGNFFMLILVRLGSTS